MTYRLYLVVAACALAGAGHGQGVQVVGPNRFAMLEGATYTIVWTAREPVDSVSVIATGHKTPLGSRSRGDFVIQIAESIPAEEGRIEWVVPWIDADSFFIKLKGYDESGQLVTTTQRGYGFRPQVMANRMEDGIFLDLHTRDRQRLYVQRDYRITRAYLSTSSREYDWRPPDSHIKAPHDHAGVFSVLEKKMLHRSVLFGVDMPYAMRYHGGHFIHATSPNLYQYLGAAASSGCNRLTLEDARELYITTPVGTRVEIVGPDG